MYVKWIEDSWKNILQVICIREVYRKKKYLSMQTDCNGVFSSAAYVCNHFLRINIQISLFLFLNIVHTFVLMSFVSPLDKSIILFAIMCHHMLLH